MKYQRSSRNCGKGGHIGHQTYNTIRVCVWVEVVYTNKPKTKNILALSYVDKKKNQKKYLFI